MAEVTGAAGRFFAWSMIAQIVSLAVLPLITRIYDVQSFGTLSLMLNFLLVPSAIACMRYDNAIFLESDERSLIGTIQLCAISTLFISVVSGALFLLLHNKAIGGLQSVPLCAVGAISGYLVLSGALSIVRANLLRSERYSIIAQGYICRNTVNGVTKISAGLGKPSFWSLAIAENAALLATVVYGGKSVSSTLRQSCVKPNSAVLKRVIVKWRRFPVYEIPSVVIDQATQAIPMFALASHFDARAVGYFSLAYRMASLPQVGIANSIAEVSRGKFAMLWKQRRGCDIRKLYYRSLVVLFASGACIYTILAVFASKFAGHLFGDKWAAAGALAPILCLWCGTSFVVSPLSSIVQVAQKQHLKLIYDILAFGLVCCAGYVFSQDTLLAAVTAMTLAMVIANLIYLVILLVVVAQIENLVPLGADDHEATSVSK